MSTAPIMRYAPWGIEDYVDHLRLGATEGHRTIAYEKTITLPCDSPLAFRRHCNWAFGNIAG
jgi:hypothetical protein